MDSGDFERGKLLFDAGSWQQAMPFLRRAVQQAPDHAEALASLAICVSHTPERAEAVELARRAVASAPNDSYCMYSLAWCLRITGETRELFERAEEAVRLAPVFSAAKLLLATAHLEHGSPKKGEQLCLEILREDPADSEAKGLLAHCQLRLGKKAESQAASLEALREQADASLAHDHLARLALLRGDLDTAEQHIQVLLHDDPGSLRNRVLELLVRKSRWPIYGRLIAPIERWQALRVAPALFCFGLVVTIPVLYGLRAIYPDSSRAFDTGALVAFALVYAILVVPTWGSFISPWLSGTRGLLTRVEAANNVLSGAWITLLEAILASWWLTAAHRILWCLLAMFIGSLHYVGPKENAQRDLSPQQKLFRRALRVAVLAGTWLAGLLDWPHWGWGFAAYFVLFVALPSD